MKREEEEEKKTNIPNTIDKTKKISRDV